MKLHNYNKTILDNTFIRILLMLLVSLVFLLFMSPSTSPICYPTIMYDSSIFLTIGQGFVKGYIPYIDLWDHKGPILWFIEAIGQIIYPGKIGMFFLQALLLTVSLSLSYKISRLYTNPIASSISVIIYLVAFAWAISGGNSCEELAQPFIIFSLYLTLKHCSESPNTVHPLKYSFIYGFCWAVTALIRLDLTAIIDGIIIGFVISFVKEGNIKNLLTQALVLFLGILCVFIPVSMFFFAHDAFEEMIYATFAFNFKYKMAGDNNGLFSFILAICFLLPCFVMMTILPIKKDLKTIYILRSVSVILFLALITGNHYDHYYTMVIPILVLATSLLLESIRNIKSNKYKTVLLIMLAPYTIFGLKYSIEKIVSNTYSPTFIHKEADLSLSRIPKNELNKVWCYNFFGLGWVFNNNNIIPCYKHFGCTISQEKVDQSITNDVISYLKSENAPLWIFVGTRVKIENQEFLDIINTRYECSFSSQKAKTPYNLYHIKTLKER